MSIFTSSIVKKPKRSRFDLSHNNKMSFNFGDLVPMLVEECIPGDVFKHNHELYMSFAPMATQVFQKFILRTEYFFVPNRLIYTDFEKFLVDESQSYVMPYFLAAGQDYIDLSAGSLADFLGVPSLSGANYNYLAGRGLSLLPFRAYQLIYNEYYRDQNLIPEIPIDKGGGLVVNPSSELFVLRRRAYPKDYFTSCLPTAQKGDPVLVPSAGGQPVIVVDADGNPYQDTNNHVLEYSRNSQGSVGLSTSNNSSDTRPDAQIVTGGDGGTIEDLNTAIRVQEWKERTLRGGSRYKEQIASHFGVTVPDYRLDRPEYLCGTLDTISMGKIYSTNNSDGEISVQGYPVSVGTGAGVGGSFKYKVKEHGFIIGIVSAYPRASYYQGLPKRFTRSDKFDFLWPEFANLGEQEVKNEELYCGAGGEQTFGYQSRYADYKTHLDEVHGDFRTSSMDMYHDARRFSSMPSLSKSFIEVNPDVDATNRVFNDTLNEDAHLLFEIRHNMRALRCLPYFGIPKI